MILSDSLLRYFRFKYDDEQLSIDFIFDNDSRTVASRLIEVGECERAIQELISDSDDKEVFKFIAQKYLENENYGSASYFFEEAGDLDNCYSARLKAIGQYKDVLEDIDFRNLADGRPEMRKFYEKDKVFLKKLDVESSVGYSPLQTWLAIDKIKDNYDVAISIAKGGLFSGFVWDLHQKPLDVWLCNRRNNHDIGKLRTDVGDYNGKRVLILENDYQYGGTLNIVTERILE
ncbi:hypothetical protein KY334_07110, partial [Candidatus Woesearchaeota archaeon]|nr:hypothetical protein [Candidatus Woesearchaeota archaeon]